MGLRRIALSRNSSPELPYPKGLFRNNMHDWPEAIFERDKERRMRILEYVRDERRRRSQKASWPFGGVPSLVRCCVAPQSHSGAMLLVRPCLELKAGTPNRPCYF